MDELIKKIAEEKLALIRVIQCHPHICSNNDLIKLEAQISLLQDIDNRLKQKKTSKPNRSHLTLIK